jgi:hypothetical protein
MDAIFSLEYSEYQTIENLVDFLPKSKGYSFYVPVSRQQAGVDFVILHGIRMLRAQVKSSRQFEWPHSPTFRFWYHKFAYRPGIADVFFFFGLYPVFSPGKKVSDRLAHWQNLILVFSDVQMRNILNRSNDRFFQFGIDPITFRNLPKVTGTRGGLKGRDLTPYLLVNRAAWLRGRL